MIGRIITSDACVAEGAAWLAAAEPRFARALGAVGPLPLRLRGDGFAALLDAIIGQQVSTQSARAIWARLDAAGLTDEEAVLTATEEGLRACGLSRQKIRYAQALAAARIDYAGLPLLTDAELSQTLTAVPGIGTWTAEIYAMFSLGRADVFAHGDLALQEAARRLFDMDDRPTETQMRQMAAAWSPWRSVAARILWAYYRVSTAKEGIR
ncbi:DNA-3-methyladenine glycosylase 2 family protein [Pseudorhodobacter sp. E13]|uniref:DNA-3-methyladenine glycosylase family protein n=1 Tax=Pseudorhodobacter sp. E13 TaxID=2487931 RepID=UPI000F8F3ADF|nr:DNA-3-methyladenine glycosylase [Pseudorhodobacter sp. E13]RUS64964.1 DNA-3-methyladenine glycosylase 2 family protein [Pseudorhodobacter sp. E13]